MSKGKDTVKKGGVDEGYRLERIEKPSKENYEEQVKKRLYEELSKKK